MPTDFDGTGRFRPGEQLPDVGKTTPDAFNTPPFEPGVRVVHLKRPDGFVVARCERRLAIGGVQWVVDDEDGKPYSAAECKPWVEGAKQNVPLTYEQLRASCSCMRGMLLDRDIEIERLKSSVDEWRAACERLRESVRRGAAMVIEMQQGVLEAAK